jgi:hypothetical protein
MKQYCKFCASCCHGDVYYCLTFEKVLSESYIRKQNSCKEFALCDLGDVDTGKPYIPRGNKSHETTYDSNEKQLELF